MSSRMDKVDVVILAGAPAGDFAESMEGNPVSRALIPVAGKTMLQWELEAMRGAQSVSRIYVVGNVPEDGVDRVVAPQEGFLSNIMAGISAASEGGAAKALLATSDIPMVTPESIDDFVRRALEAEADFCYPIVPKEECVRKYPGMRRTYLKLREGTFSGGNMVLVSVDFVLRNRDSIARAYAARKQPLRLAGMIGYGVLARVLLAQLIWPGAVNAPYLESAVGRVLNGRVRAVITDHAEICEDVDRPEELAEVEKALGRVEGRVGANTGHN